MATSCEDNNWFWVYFTSVYNIAKCDICYKSFQITELPKDNIMRHIETVHRDDYQRIVSSGYSQKDLESQLYIIQNNDITCNFCNSMFDALNNSCSLINHLGRKHKIQKDLAAAICDCVREHYFDEIDTDMKRRCKSCNETILNKPLHLMSHLNKAHEVDVPFKSKSIMGFLTSKNWIWAYYTRNYNLAICSVCSKTYSILTNIQIIINHIKMAHGNMFDVTEISQAYENWPYSITENDQVQCDNCNVNYALIFYATPTMRTHLAKEHNLNEDIGQKLCNWVLEYFHISNLQTSKCNRCENVFRKSNFFDLMIHLKEAHQVGVPPEIIPASSQLPTCSFDQSSDCDILYGQIDESSEIRTSRYAENNATSSSYQQPTQNSDSDNLFDLIDEYTENELTRYAENNATSSNHQQPTQNLYQNSDTDNLFDLIDEYTEN